MCTKMPIATDYMPGTEMTISAELKPEKKAKKNKVKVNLFGVDIHHITHSHWVTVFMPCPCVTVFLNSELPRPAAHFCDSRAVELCTHTYDAQIE